MAPPCALRHSAAARRVSAGERGVEPAHRLVDLGLADDQRRQQAHDVVAGRHEEQALGARGGGDLAVRDAALDAEHQPLAADFLDEVGMRVGDRRELLLQEQPGAAHAARGKPRRG